MQSSTNQTFYDLFGLPKNATKTEIKKSYYDLAKKYHPDKNKDENAEEMFKIISEAYIILSDDQNRKEYDEYIETTTNVNLDELIIMLRKVFGGEHFKNYIGEMIFYNDIQNPKSNQPWIYNLFKSDNKNYYNQGMIRISNLIQFLEERVQFYIFGGKNNFKLLIIEEAKIMSSQPNESDLLSLLGYLYVREAKKQSFFGSFEKINSNKYLKKEYDTLMKLTDFLNYFHDNAFFSTDYIRKVILNGIWLIGRLEIIMLIKEVCKVFFNVPEKKLKKNRINAIKTMGEIFLEYGKQNVDFDLILKLFELEL
ncbi:hypothetical protein ACTFIV_010362 [Dictyostelium citrinum]